MIDDLDLNVSCINTGEHLPGSVSELLFGNAKHFTKCTSVESDESLLLWLKDNGCVADEKSIIILPLDEMPFALPEPWVPACLTKRTDPQTTIYFQPDAKDFTQDYFMRFQCKVFCKEPLLQIQLKQLRNDLVFTNDVAEAEAIVESFKFEKQSAILSQEKFEILPEELIPKPGSGALVILCSKHNLSLRRQLKAIHAERAAWCTNLERKISKLYLEQHGKAASLYVKMDSMNQFHLNGFRQVDESGPLENIRLSMSSTAGLEREITARWQLS